MPAPAAKIIPLASRPEAGQLAFDWLIPWGPRKQILTTPEASEVLSVGQDVIRALIETAELHAHRFNATGETERKTNRVTRESVRLYLAKTADYGHADRAEAVLAVTATFSPCERAALITSIQKQNKS